MQGAGVTTANFSATVTFVNPTEQTETPWDVGFAFHENPEQSAGPGRSPSVPMGPGTTRMP